MPVTLELREGGRIMYWRFEDPWTIAELVHKYPVAKTYLDAAQHTLHTLIDASAVRSVPSNAMRARTTSTWHHPRSGYTAVVSSSTLLRSLVNAAFRMARFERVKFFAKEDEALAYLHALIEQE